MDTIVTRLLLELRKAGLMDGSMQIQLLPDGRMMRVFVRGVVNGVEMRALAEEPASAHGLKDAINRVASGMLFQIPGALSS